MLSAEASDPNRLGWMQGFPPPPERIIGQPDSNYFSFPKMCWTVCHFRELLPTKQVSRGLGRHFTGWLPLFTRRQLPRYVVVAA